MRPTPQYTAIRTSKAFDDFLGALYMKAKRDAEEIVVPPLRVISDRGNEPPARQQFQHAIAALYGIGYSLKMGLKFELLREGRSVQALHVGPYDQEQPTVERIRRYLDDHGLVVKGRHHEIYISDPRRTSPAKLKTVIRFAVARRAAAR